MNRKELSRLLTEIEDKEYRRGLVEGHAKDTIAFQLKQLRKALNWEQRDVAKELGNPKLQPMISRYENPDYGKYSITTLLELAAVFDVALVVRFAPFSELVEWDLSSSPKTLCPSPYAKDEGLAHLAAYAGREESRSDLSNMGEMNQGRGEKQNAVDTIDPISATPRKKQENGFAGIGSMAS